MKSYMVGMKITRPSDRGHKNNSPKNGELNSQDENNLVSIGNADQILLT